MTDRHTILGHIENTVDLDEWAIIGVKESFEELEKLQKENKKLKTKCRKIKQQVRILKAQKSVDLTGDVLEVGKYICAYHKLIELTSDK